MGLAKNEGNNIIKDHIIIMVPFPKVGNRAGSVSSVHSSYTVRGNCPHTKPATWRTRGCPDVKPFTLDQSSMVGPSRGKTSTSSSPRKVTLHRMICNDNLYRNTALQRWNHVGTIQNNVATLCCAKSRRCKSSCVTSPLRNEKETGLS